MRTEHLAEFVELARCLNFTVAAKRLAVSQPALSNHIRQLEKELRTQLIVRPHAGRPARLTPAGECVLDYAQRVLTLEDELTNNLAHTKNGLCGQLRVRLIQPELSSLVVSRLSLFAQEYPHVELDIDRSQPGSAVDDLEQGAIDLACVGPLEAGLIEKHQGTLGFTPLGSATLGIWVSDASPYYSRTSIQPTEIDGTALCVPASPKNKQWEDAARALLEPLGCDVSNIERVANSWDDFVISKLRNDDIVLTSDLLASMPAMALRSNRRFVPFEGPVLGHVGVAYRLDDDSAPLKALLAFLEEASPIPSAALQ